MSRLERWNGDWNGEENQKTLQKQGLERWNGWNGKNPYTAGGVLQPALESLLPFFTVPVFQSV